MKKSPRAPLPLLLSVLGFSLFTASAVGLFAFLQYTSSDDFVRKDREALNRIGSMTPEQIKATCESMSHWSYVSGLTDGAFVSFGRTYYYRSSCFMEFARMTRDKRYCNEVRARHALFQSDSGISRDACLKLVEQTLEQNAQQEKESNASRAHRDAILSKAAKLTISQVVLLSPGNWELRMQAAGSLHGEYEIEVNNLSAKLGDPNGVLFKNRNLIREPLFTWSIPINLQQLEKCGEPCRKTTRRIYPLAASLTLLKPDSDSGASLQSPIQTSVVNLSLSID